MTLDPGRGLGFLDPNETKPNQEPNQSGPGLSQTEPPVQSTTSPVLARDDLVLLASLSPSSSAVSAAACPPPPPVRAMIPDAPSVVGSVRGHDRVPGTAGHSEFAPLSAFGQGTGTVPPDQSNPDIKPSTAVHDSSQGNFAQSPSSSTATAPIPIPSPSYRGLALRASHAPAQPTMIFSDLYRSPRSPIAKFRNQPVPLNTALSTATPDWVGEEHADLLSKDKMKQKEAVKRYLQSKIKNDWDFPWPSRVPSEDKTASDDQEKSNEQPGNADTTEPAKPVQDEIHEDPGYQVDEEDADSPGDDSDAESVYSVVSEDLANFRPRTEWTSDLSDEEDEPFPFRSPFRFDSPGAVGVTVQAGLLAKRTKRRREIRKEMEWNEGLACFEARRNAWTGARTVRIRTKPVSPPATSPRSARRFFFRRSMSSSPPSSTLSSALPPASDGSDGSSLAKSDDKELQKQQSKDTSPSTPPSVQNYPVETLIPVAPPLLPPNNPLRASVTPSVYLSLYDKVILHNLQPSCPINLSDMLRACVAGWKRDGEWPPRPTAAPPPVVKKKKKPAPASDNSGNKTRRMSFGLLGRDKDEESAPSKIFRRSLQKALNIANYGAQDVPTAEKPKEG